MYLRRSRLPPKQQLVISAVAVALWIGVESCEYALYGPATPTSVDVTAVQPAPGPAPHAPHMSGAFYPEDHPEMLTEAPKVTRAPGVFSILSIGLAGIAAAFLAGAVTFTLLGRFAKDDAEHIVIGSEPDPDTDA